MIRFEWVRDDEVLAKKAWSQPRQLFGGSVMLDTITHTHTRALQAINMDARLANCPR